MWSIHPPPSSRTSWIRACSPVYVAREVPANVACGPHTHGSRKSLIYKDIWSRMTERELESETPCTFIILYREFPIISLRFFLLPFPYNYCVSHIYFSVKKLNYFHPRNIIMSSPKENRKFLLLCNKTNDHVSLLSQYLVYPAQKGLKSPCDPAV
jgi:hypothetical protein